jgi:hypothetical protein
MALKPRGAFGLRRFTGAFQHGSKAVGVTATLVAPAVLLQERGAASRKVVLARCSPTLRSQRATAL